MFLRDSDTILLVLSVSRTSETNYAEALAMSLLSLFSSAIMATEKMAGGTESSEKKFALPQVQGTHKITLKNKTKQQQQQKNMPRNKETL